MSTIKNFEDLEVWQLAREQSKKICKLLKSTPFTREFDLVNQMKRSSGSVMDNIAEGFDREGNNEFIHFLSVSKGSNSELRSQLYRTLDNCLIEKNDFDLLFSDNLLIGKKINSFMEYLKTTDNKGSKFKRTSSFKPQTYLKTTVLQFERTSNFKPRTYLELRFCSLKGLQTANLKQLNTI